MALLDHAKAAGLTLEAAPDGRLLVTPRSRLTPELRAALLEHKAALLAALAGPRPPEPPDPVPVPAEAVALRVAAFRAQLAAWTTGGHSGVPLLTLQDLPASGPGRCIGCGAVLSPGRAWRCAACVAAVELVLGLPPVRFDQEAAR
jgi:hypothetical protein